MVSRKDQPVPLLKGRPVWQRALLICLNIVLAAGALWLGMSIPSYFRSVSPLVLEAAAEGTLQLESAAADQLQAGRPGIAKPLLAAFALTRGETPPPATTRALEQLLSDNPDYRWSGGPAPFFEQFVRQAAYLDREEPFVIPSFLPRQHREQLLGFLVESPNQNVQKLLQTRELIGWQRFYPVSSTSGHPLEATILVTALLEQASSFPDGLQKPLMEAVSGALEGDQDALSELETIYLSLLTLGRYTNWLELKTFIQELETSAHLFFAAQAIQDDPAKWPLLFSVIHLTRDPGSVVGYLARYDERGWSAFEMALGMGQGAVSAVLQFDKPVYHPPGFWKALPSQFRQNQQAFKRFAEGWPEMAIGARAVLFALCGFFLVGILRTLVLGGRRGADHQRRVLINLDSLVGGVLVMLFIWVLIEPGLLEFRPNEEGTLQINMAQLVPDVSNNESETPVSTMIDQVTILVLLLFFVLQLLVFIFGLLKIGEVRKQSVSPQVKLNLLENEENLFDLGLYVGLGGTVSSLILVVLNIVDASLMAAYASTLFGIIFVALLKIGFVRPFKRKLIIEKN